MRNALIPQIFLGERSVVVKSAKLFVSRSVKNKKWDVHSMPQIPISDLTDDVVIERPTPYDYPKGLFLDTVKDALCSACRSADRVLWFRDQFAMTLRGLDHFWFVLSFLSQGSPLIQATVSAEERAMCFKQFAEKLSGWWEVLTRIDHRIVAGVPHHRGWPHWRSRVIGVLLECGIMGEDDFNDASALSIQAVGQRLQQLQTLEKTKGISTSSERASNA